MGIEILGVSRIHPEISQKGWEAIMLVPDDWDFRQTFDAAMGRDPRYVMDGIENLSESEKYGFVPFLARTERDAWELKFRVENTGGFWRRLSALRGEAFWKRVLIAFSVKG